MNIHPGSKIRILEDGIFRVDDVATDIYYTKGSLGTVLSYKGFSDAITGYPIRIDEYVPLSENDYASLVQSNFNVYESCHVGCVRILDPNVFEVI